MCDVSSAVTTKRSSRRSTHLTIRNKTSAALFLLLLLLLLLHVATSPQSNQSLLDKNSLALEDIAEFELQLRDRIDSLEGSAGRPLAKLGSIDCVIDLTEDDEDDPDPAHHQTLKADGAGEWIS